MVGEMETSGSRNKGRRLNLRYRVNYSFLKFAT